VNKAIIAADALSLSKGITNSSTFEVGIKKKLLEISETHILLTDSSKFNKSCLYKVADWSSIHTIITDEGITDETAQALESMGIKLYVV
jgi:DeoR/GlpR family transcriptional regulator of sugar metabolism